MASGHAWRPGDPGKHVQTWLPTSLWKRLAIAARRDRISLSRAVYDAVEAWLNARGPQDPEAGREP